MERVGPRTMLLESLPNKQSSCSFSQDIEPWTSPKYENTFTDIKNRRKQNFEDEANNMQLDKRDSQRSNLNSKYLNVTLLLTYPDCCICF